MSDSANSIKKENAQETNIPITDTQKQHLKKAMKCGIYKELHKRRLLSDTQLNDLIGHITERED